MWLQVETEGDVATANTLARILSNVPPSRGGPTSLVIFDIHALQVRRVVTATPSIGQRASLPPMYGWMGVSGWHARMHASRTGRAEPLSVCL